MKQLLTFLVGLGLSTSVLAGSYSVQSTAEQPSGSGYHIMVTDPNKGTLYLRVFLDDWQVWEVVVENASGAGGSWSPGYTGHSGLQYSITLVSNSSGVDQIPTPCTIANIDVNNPLATTLRNCTLSGGFNWFSGATTNGWQVSYNYNVKATFDSSGVGTFTLTPISASTHVSSSGPSTVPPISSFQATFAQLLQALY